MFSSACLVPADQNVSNQLIDRFLIADEDGDLLLVNAEQGQGHNMVVPRFQN